ncbi:alpha/beta hydrolase family protein [Aliiglaciecola sp. M165]|uniref:alpha/beta hydrolase family protein n=1 Tax=Aliiglaciecola sp. M165 TaxID=2593649 RepID=UPI00117DB1F5|nr:S9 family peptidase [Aliiglaciecola sp. M165]TRY33397.1 S9 family peptidase [Aliiglaciecola sp. M165]
MQYIKPLAAQILCVTFVLFSSISQAMSPADFAKDYQYHDAQISPDGKHIALVINDDGKRKLAVVKSSDFSSVGGADFGKKQEVGDFFWVNNERLVIGINYYLPWQDQPVPTGELFAIDYNGKRGEIIYGFRAGEQGLGNKMNKKESTRGFAVVVNRLDDEEDYIQIASFPWSRDGSRVPTLHKLNVNNGRLGGIIAGGPAAFTDFVTDKQGNVKLAVGFDNQNQKRAFRYLEEKNDWAEIPRENFGRGYNPLVLDAKGEYLYLIDDKDHDKEGLYKMHLESGEKQLIYRDEKVDIANVEFSYDGTQIYAFRTDPDYPNYVVFDKSSDEAKVYEFLVNSFRGYRVTITSSSADGNLWTVYAHNDRSAGGFYLYDKKANQFKLLFSNFTHVPQNKLSESIPFAFNASDGQVINGYVTYPATIDPSINVPLITLVHGGPAARDYWSFNREVQMLAAQGYAVVRLNFRGSTGYGNQHLDGSIQQWGDRVQKDIIEGTKWVIQQGGIDQNKVCIMGASFGGYSAAMSSAMAPNLFKCAVANAGIYDLEMLFEEGDIPRIFTGIAFLEDELGTDKEVLRSQSPVNFIEQVKGPFLIAHGERDERAPFVHAEKLMEAMDANGKQYETFIRGSEGHGFYDEKNRTEYFEKVAGFLAKHLK